LETQDKLSLFFVRHGETEYNRRGIVQGSGVDSSLNDLGRQQANAFFQAYQQLSFDQLYVSELQRTHQTLSPWLSQGYEWEVSSGLNELNWGIHEGVVPTEGQRAEFLQTIAKWQAGHLEEKVTQGESPLEAWNRARPFFESILQDDRPRRLLFCSHGRQLRVILSNLMRLGMTEMERFKHHNTAVTVLHLVGSAEPFLEKLNDTSHLATLVDLEK
ncbi:MAG: histidine phosphatase family protein, partial [Bacteroidota bacterium]